jgi:nucleoside 2-deoxyribosyltransferase
MAKKLYLAGPLFSQPERRFNHELKKLLEPYFEVYLPQEDGILLVEVVKQGASPEKAKQEIFESDLKAIEECDLFLGILDGRTLDEGTCFELGFAYAHGKECYGLKTDPRQLLPQGNNPMIEGALIKVFSSVEELVAWAKNKY